jgi:hypothetical protein
MARENIVHTVAATLRVFSPQKAISTFVALSRGLDELYSVPQDLPDSIARALARLESPAKTNQKPSRPRLAATRRQVSNH